MASMLRSPVFYYLAAVLQQYGERSIVAGTINKSEGSYIGYFGKYSDGAVDIQVIADIYKHEVFQVAKELGIPSEIIQETPKGDVWSGVSDEELIGVSYEFLDMYLMLKEFDLKIQDFGPTDDEFLKDFNKSAEIVENLNRINRHKYKHGSGPAAFLDVMPRKIRGGWV
jgi:NAD+ synthase (glutamine-hydrolysing)